ncbi:hypothetical protein LOTGIDRAFT_125208 [Lottia gigantea]|uniref:Large ribosomal subunit protein uL22m n=1 Tax=Lottia gigantea TaxID=225164 RepID=V4A833_LOTGI|nr:hypothetical protein LOTGIDRAFT_125208 [Lottia gigantea]ESO89431.1 hypothetical protein LOTGIDRAFT_125208 [Lottia gigantea]
MNKSKLFLNQKLTSIICPSVRFFNVDGPNSIKLWNKYNKIVYRPRKPGEPRLPAEVTHYRQDIKYSPDKLWFLACMIRGMSIDDAVKQLSFNKQKGSKEIKEVLLEAQTEAVELHNVEFKSNLWIADSLVGRGIVHQGIRFHTRGRAYRLKLRHANYFVRLREGKPPKHYYPPPPTGNEKLEEYIQEMRSRRIKNEL